jgi:hypothetical protein
MLENKHGKFIDSHDVVIRQKRCSDTLKHPEQFGSKTTYVCGSYTIAPQLPQDMPGAEYWVFMDSRHQEFPPSSYEWAAENLPCTILKPLCDRWNAKYRAKRKPFHHNAQMRRFDELGHPHLSAGFHTILYTCEILRPEAIDLVGFDNIKTGDFTWSITRGPDYVQYPDHCWNIEHDMIAEVEDAYGTRCNFV